MVNLKKYSDLFKRTGVIVLTAGSGCLVYQIYQTTLTISRIVKSDVVNLKRNKSEYIYISDPKFNVLYESNQESERDSKCTSILQSILPTKWWKWWKHTYAWRLLSMAQQGSRDDRLRAVRTLAGLKHLKDSDYWQLAQVCDARTAVGLARSEDVDLRFFLKPPHSPTDRSKQDLLEGLRKLLVSLDYTHNHPCVQYFLLKAFPDVQDKHIVFESDMVTLEPSHTLIKGEEVLPLCVGTLLHHLALTNNAENMLTLGGLTLLMEVYKHFSSKLEVMIMLAKSMSIISLQDGVLNDLFVSGWIGVLARWAQDANIRLASPAARALANLDQDDRLEGTYARRIYLLHPTHRVAERTKVDVVFIHGLLGGVFVTWRQRDGQCSEISLLDSVTCGDSIDVSPGPVVSDEEIKEYLDGMQEFHQEEWDHIGSDYEMIMSDCPVRSGRPWDDPCECDQYCLYETCPIKKRYTSCWPKDWLASDIRHLRVIGINYDTSISRWTPMCPAENAKRKLDDRSEEFLKKLHQAGVGTRPIIWVAHSMGGLLVKNMLLKAFRSDDASIRAVHGNTKGIMFYSVPHYGSPLAALRQATSLLLWPSIEVQELRENSSALLDLHEDFLEMLKKSPIEIISFAETLSTMVKTLRLELNFIPTCSADPGIGEFYEVPQDHLSICKPADRQSFLYQKLLHLIKKYMPTE